MGILHPGITQSSLVLRSEKTTRLSILESDGNLVYLEDSVLGLSQSIASLPVVPEGGTGGQVLAKVSGTDYHLEWVYQTGGGGTGTAGTSGTSGVDGTSGTSGVDGTSGTSGVDGTSGTSGVDGTSGVNGADGTNGTSGVNGADGTNGTSGTSGERGAVGSTFNILGIFPNYSALTQTVGTMSSVTPPNSLDSYIVIDTSSVWVYGPTASMGLTPSVANSDGWVDMGPIEGPQGLPGVNGADGTNGTSGVNGADGTNGTSGVNGADGIGIPAGGNTGQVLAKFSDNDYDLQWTNQTGGGGTGTNGTSGINGANGTNGTSGTSGVNGGLDIINNIFSLSSYNFNSLNPNILLPGDYFVDVNNDSYEIILPWDINFLGATYGSVWLNSNSYMTFGASSSASQSIAPGVVAPPAIFVGAGDNSLQGYYFGFDDEPVNEVFRIRYEGSHDESGDFNFNPTIAWEMVFNFNTPNDIKLVVGENLRNPGGVYGISDGANWIERFTAIPTYNEKTNTMLNAVDISSIDSGASYSQSTNEIKFVGPGVYKVSEGTKTTINIDPLNQYGVSINYDTAGASVISSNKYDLRLSTGKDGSAVRIRPRGDIFLQPTNRNDNQYGPGYNVRLIGSNASKDLIGNGDYDGGSIFIAPGSGIGLGSTGSVQIGSDGSNVTLIGSSVLAEDYSATFTNRSIVDKEYVDMAVAGVTQSLADTLAIGNYSGDNDIVMKHNRKIYNEDLSGGTTYGTSSIITYIEGDRMGSVIQASPDSVGVNFQNPGATESSSVWASSAPGQGGVVSISSTGPTYYTVLSVYSGISSIGSYKSSDNDPNLAFKGLEYVHNYSASFVDRSLVDKGYVDNAISGGISGAISGWSGTYLTGDSRTVTVSNGIITGVA